MVPRSRAPLPPHELRSLNAPEPVRVEKDGAGSIQVLLRAHRLTVDAVCDEWRVVDEWWRQPLSRRYLLLLMTDGRRLTLFQDRLTGRWYRQSY